MSKILNIEILRYLKSPLTYGFLVLPSLIYFILINIVSVPYALSNTIFFQTIFISFFAYGNRIIVYQKNQTLKMKINNSKRKQIEFTISILLITLTMLLSSLVMPIIFSTIMCHSNKWIMENQYWYFLESDPINVNSVLLSGLDQNYLLLTSSFLLWLQFSFAFTLLCFVSFSFSNLLIKLSKDQLLYFSISTSFSIILIIFSDSFIKNIYILGENEYTRNNNFIDSFFWNFLKKLNPFFWANKLLMNTIIADQFSGVWSSSLPTGIDAAGTYSTTYFNIFHIGTNINLYDTSDRLIFINQIELIQIMNLFVPIISSASFIVFSFLISEVWT